MKVFITGATGFIGGEVARLLRERGDEVRALVRNPARAATLEELGCTLVSGDLTDGAAIQKGMTGCDGVIHGAAVYEVGIPKSARPAMFEANVKGTERVLGAALELKIPRVVYVSTVGAFGNTHGEIVDEAYTHPGTGFTSYYEETKVGGHRVAEDLIAKGLPLVIIQPGGVYGPHDPSPQGVVIKQFLDGKLPAMMFPKTGFNMVHRDDVAAGIILALDKGKPGQAYVLGGEITTVGGLIATLGRVAGRKPPALTLPGFLIKPMIPFGPWIAPLLGFGPNLGEIVKAADGVTYWAKDDRARRELGYKPRGLEKGLRDTLAAEGRIPA